MITNKYRIGVLMYETISYEKSLNEKDSIYVDVRTPREYNLYTIPGAINIPVLLDEERGIVGTLYKQKSVEEAKLAGVTFIANRLPEIFSQFQELYAQYKKVYVFCSRGGYRSSSIVSFLFSLGIHILKIEGGYKAYRQYIRLQLPEIVKKIHPIVLYGNTGCGKTKILQEIRKMDYPVVDLEALANHRGSLLGGVGLGEQRSQKMFESYLYEDLLKADPYIFMEGESRRIGNISLPKDLYDKMPTGISINIESSMDYRVNTLLEDYIFDEENLQEKSLKEVNFVKDIHKALEHIKRYFSKEKIDLYHELIRKKDYRKVAEELCEFYYDPRYMNRVEKFDLEIRNEDEKIAGKEIIEKLVQEKIITKI